MAKKLTLCTMDGDTLEVEVHPGYINMWLYELGRQQPDDHTALRLSTGASLELRDAILEGMLKG